MLRPNDEFFLGQQEPSKSCLQFLRELILNYDKEITEGWAYGLPFFYFKGKRFCYLWTHKKFGQPYIGIVDGRKIHFPGLLTENRSRMKIFLVDPSKNIPVREIKQLLRTTLALYR
jgi:Domain of unknown function (DU1801)